jgi:nitronate monooxygenase
LNLITNLQAVRKILSIPENEVLPIGIGFITIRPASDLIKHAIPIVVEHKPAVVWLFAPSSRDQHSELIPAFKAAGRDWGLKVFVQVGTVQAAREAVQDGVDVVVVQGTDAGGHQFAKGASVVTLVPEVLDMIANEFKAREVPVIAAGGIMDGRGVAAALALGELSVFDCRGGQ